MAGLSTEGQAKRRTERVLIQIPIEVKGKDAEGKPFSEKSRTIVINRNGARISLRTSLRPEHRITITNLQNQLSCPFRVVSRIEKSISLEPEWGVECLEPEVNFWAIWFPEKTTASVEGERIDALLECSVCRSRELAQLRMEEYRALAGQSSLDRDCPQCQKATPWHFCFVDEPAVNLPDAPVAGTEKPAPATGAERRRAKRLTAKLPVRIRMPGGVEEISRTENLSTTGVCFYSKQEIKTGDEIGLTVGDSPEGTQREFCARVVWGRPVGGDDQFLYGVRLEEGR